MVMEYVTGATVADLIVEVSPLPVSWAVAIGAQVCAVLAAAHEFGLVHQDLSNACASTTTTSPKPSSVRSGRRRTSFSSVLGHHIARRRGVIPLPGR